MVKAQDLIDRLTRLVSDKEPWTKFHFDVARYTLPDAERFDGVFSTRSGATDAVVSTTIIGGPIATERGREIYDQTSLFAVDRGANGTLSLTTPQTMTWHDLTSDDPFGGDPSDEETRWYEKVRDYLFRARGNPRSGFWTAQKSCMRSTWAFGTAVNYIEESDRGASAPISYRYVPISECHLDVDFEGNVDTNFRLFRRSAKACVQRWGEKCSAKVKEMAADPKRKDTTVNILHAVYPRKEGVKGYAGQRANTEMPWASCYVEVDEKHLIGEGGFEEFPYRVDHWQRNNPGPYAEGPIAIALADVKSLNMLSKQELLATQQWVRPPLATVDDSQPRLNLNMGASNPGYMSSDGKMLVAPIGVVQRPDFARTVIEARQNSVKSTLYLDLWQSLIDARPGETATAAMIRNQEKGDILGPVGSSLQVGQSFMVERELAILERRGAFKPGSPLAAPQSLQGKGVWARFTSPLDKLRRLPELQAMQQLLAFAAQIAQSKPEVMDKIDADEMVDEFQEISGAPRKIMTADDILVTTRQSRNQQNATVATTDMIDKAGQAGQSAAAGIDAVASSPASADILRRIAGLTGVQPGVQAA